MIFEKQSNAKNIRKRVDNQRKFIYNISCPDKNTGLRLGCRQAVRHWTLTPACNGSNPFSPATFFKKYINKCLGNRAFFLFISNYFIPNSA